MLKESSFEKEIYLLHLKILFFFVDLLNHFVYYTQH